MFCIVFLKSREAFMIEDDNDKLRYRIFKAKEHSRYPGACEAQLILNDLQKARCQTYFKRMKVFYLHLYYIFLQSPTIYRIVLQCS